MYSMQLYCMLYMFVYNILTFVYIYIYVHMYIVYYVCKYPGLFIKYVICDIRMYVLHMCIS